MPKMRLLSLWTQISKFGPAWWEWCRSRGRGCWNWERLPSGTFVLEPNEPFALSTAASAAGTLSLDSKLARHPGRKPGEKTPGALPGCPETASSLCISSPPMPLSGRLPPGRFLLFGARFCAPIIIVGLQGLRRTSKAQPTQATRRLALPAHRAIVRQWPGTRAEPRPDGGWNVLQRRAAIAAAILGTVLDAKPVAASGASRIQTLHGGTRQILHRASFFSGKESAGD